MSQPLRISELSARSPEMDESEFAALVADIEANGQLVPIVIRNGEVIDGRKRLAACKRLGIEPKSVTLDDSQDAESVARALNILRTHYTPGQRGIYAGLVATFRRGEVGGHKSITKFSDRDRPLTEDEAATRFGIAKSTVIIAKKVAREGAPEVVQAVKAGDLTLHAAQQIVKTVPRAEQPSAVERVVETNKAKTRNSPVAKVLRPEVDPRKDRAAPKPSHEQFARAVQSMDVLADVLAANVDAANGDARRRAFLETLSHVRTTLTRVIRAMEIAA